MLPEVQAYFAIMNNHDYSALVEAERDNPVPAWSATLSETERAEYYAADNKRQEAVRKVDHAWKEKEAQALDGLLNSENALVKWVVNHPVLWGSEYQREAKDVLFNLPMTKQELEEYGAQQYGGGVFDRFIQEAENAGVFSTPEQDGATA